jgi:hypothetical protein
MPSGERNLIAAVLKTAWRHNNPLVRILTMLSFVLRRARLRLPGTFRVVQRLPTHAVLSNQLLALASQRNFTTTTNNRNKESTPNVEPEPEPKPKSKKTTETERKGTRRLLHLTYLCSVFMTRHFDSHH